MSDSQTLPADQRPPSDVSAIVGWLGLGALTLWVMVCHFWPEIVTALNLPSRADITSIGERLQAIEAQLNRLTEIVATMATVEAAPQSLAPKPKRTRKPPARANGAKP